MTGSPRLRPGKSTDGDVEMHGDSSAPGRRGSWWTTSWPRRTLGRPSPSCARGVSRPARWCGARVHGGRSGSRPHAAILLDHLPDQATQRAPPVPPRNMGRFPLRRTAGVAVASDVAPLPGRCPARPGEPPPGGTQPQPLVTRRDGRRSDPSTAPDRPVVRRPTTSAPSPGRRDTAPPCAGPLAAARRQPRTPVCAGPRPLAR